MKNSEREQVRHFLDKTFNLGVFLQSCTTTAKKCTKKCAARARLLFLLIRPIVVFSPFSVLVALALHDFIFCLNELYILSRASLLALAG